MSKPMSSGNLWNLQTFVSIVLMAGKRAAAGAARGLVGGSALALILGAFLFSWFINTFFLFPIEGVTYNLTILTVFQNLLTLPVLQFLAIAVLVWAGYFGAVFVRSHHTSKKMF